MPWFYVVLCLCIVTRAYCVLPDWQMQEEESVLVLFVMCQFIHRSTQAGVTWCQFGFEIQSPSLPHWERQRKFYWSLFWTHLHSVMGVLPLGLLLLSSSALCPNKCTGRPDYHWKRRQTIEEMSNMAVQTTVHRHFYRFFYVYVHIYRQQSLFMSNRAQPPCWTRLCSH